MRGMVLGQDEAPGGGRRAPTSSAPGSRTCWPPAAQNVMLLATLVLGLGALRRAAAAARGSLAALLLVALYVPLAGGGPSIQRAGRDGRRGAGRRAGRAAVVALVRVRARGGRRRSLLNPRARRRSRLAAVLRRRARADRARARAARRARAPGAGPGGRRGGDHDRGDDRHRAADGAALRAASRSPRCPRTCWRRRRWRRSCGSGMLAAVGGPGVARARGAARRPSPAPLLGCGGGARARARRSAPLAVLPVRLALACRRSRCACAGRRSRSPPAPARLWRRRAAAAGRRSAAACARRCSRSAWLALPAIVGARRAPARRRRGSARASSSSRSSTSARATRRCSSTTARRSSSTPARPTGRSSAALRDAGVRRLDLLVLTHAELDHEGNAPRGAARASRRGCCSTAARAGRRPSSAPCRAAVRAARHACARRAGGPGDRSRRACASRCSGRRPPPPGWTPAGNPNDRAVVALVRLGTFDLLLPADAESQRHRRAATCPRSTR